MCFLLVLVVAVPLLTIPAFAEEVLPGGYVDADPAGSGDDDVHAAVQDDSLEDDRAYRWDVKRNEWVPSLGYSGYIPLDDPPQTPPDYPEGELGLLMEIRDYLQVFLSLICLWGAVLVSRFIIRSSFGALLHFGS